MGPISGKRLARSFPQMSRSVGRAGAANLVRKQKWASAPANWQARAAVAVESTARRQRQRWPRGALRPETRRHEVGMIKNAVSSLMVRLHLPHAAPAPTYRAALVPLSLPRPQASASASGPLAGAGRPAMSTTAQSVADQKRALRSDLRRALKALSPDQRASEDLAIQGTILNSSWFKASKRLCAYISCAQLREVDTSKVLAEVLSPNFEHDGQAKGLYVPRVEDKNRNMKMLKITAMDDLVKNSMNILEPSPLDASGNAREDVLSASSPVDLFLLPGQGFDRTGRRLGRGGGYYDTFLMKYQELAKEKGWSQPLLVALSYSIQIMEEGIIPVNSTDVPIDALVTSSGVIPISPAACERM